MVSLLLEYKASLDMQDSEGGTALMVACSVGHPSIVRSLLRAGARTDLRDRDGDTALTVAKDNIIQRVLPLDRGAREEAIREG